MRIVNHDRVAVFPQVGERYGDWTVIKRCGDDPHDRVIVRCVCGTEREIIPSYLAHGKSTSCGCQTKKRWRDASVSFQEKQRKQKGKKYVPRFPKELPMYENNEIELAQAIVEFNVKRYRFGVYKMNGGNPKPGYMTEAENFFRKGGAEYWVGVDGESIMRILKERFPVTYGKPKKNKSKERG